MLCDANSRRTTPRSRAASCGGIWNDTAAKRPPAPGRIAKALEPCVNAPRRSPCRAENIDAAHASVGIGIELDLRLAGAARCRIFRNINDTRGTADAERRG